MPEQEESNTRPGHRELYLLVIGVIVGVLLGPGVFGRFNPQAYDDWFVGSGKNLAVIQEKQTKFEADLRALVEAKTTPIAIEELKAHHDESMAVLQAQMQALRDKTALKLSGRGHALLLAMVALMVIETMIAPSKEIFRQRISAARYCLIAAWIALALAQPALILHTPIELAIAAVAIALAAAVIPMPFRRAKDA